MVVLNQTLKVSANNSRKTFTIRTYVNGKFSSKYRTYPTNKHEFERDLNNTENDWKQFLSYSSDYYAVR